MAWRPVYSLRCQRAVVNTHLEMRLAQGLVGEPGPAGPQRPDLRDSAGETSHTARLTGHVEAGLGAKAARPDFARAREQVRVMVPRVAVRAGIVHRDVDGNAVEVGNLAREPDRQRGALWRRELVRQGDRVLARHARVASRLGAFDRIPELLAIPRPSNVTDRELRRQDDFAVRDVRAVGVIVDGAGAFVHEALAGAVGGGSDCPTAGAATEWLDVETVDRQLAPDADAPSARQPYAQPGR